MGRAEALRENSENFHKADDPQSPDDGELVARARRDPGAFGALYRRYVDRIYSFAHRRTWNREAAEDVTAATFERAYRHLDRFDSTGAGFGPSRNSRMRETSSSRVPTTAIRTLRPDSSVVAPGFSSRIAFQMLPTN